MFPVPTLPRLLAMALATLAANLPTLLAQTPNDQFYQAYYLEHAQHDFAAAAGLYQEVAASSQATGELKTRAEAQLRACREELACADFARLMPPNPLAYVELNRPGESVRKLLGQLGLLAEDDGRPTAGANRLAISPAIIDAALGMRGMAAALTGFDPAAQRPAGVLVFHPGDMALVRGVIETALPVGTEPVQAIADYPTYEIEDCFITLTERLVIAGTSRGEVADVIARLRSPHEESLATNEDYAEILQDRHGELLFFCVNPKPLMPLLNSALAAGATQSRELVIFHALLDPNSLRSLTGRCDVSEAGLVLDLTLRLDEGHRNLAYNLLRRPALDPATLHAVPRGTAGLLAIALNEAPKQYPDDAAPPTDQPPVVTFLDLGREIFANINGVAVFVLPPTERREAPAGPPIPDVAAVITVNDPVKSAAVWREILGITSLIAGGPTLEGLPREVEGVGVRTYLFPDADMTMYFATIEHEVLVGWSEAAIAGAIHARRSGESILDDPAFQPALNQLGPHTTLACLAHLGRCVEVVRPFAPPDESIEPLIATLTDTVATYYVSHSDEMLRVSARVTGLPDVGELVSDLIMQERHRQGIQQQLAGEVAEFRRLARESAGPDALRPCADRVFAAIQDDPRALNNLAWSLLTEKEYQHQCDDIALRFARRSNALTDYAVWAYVDTLALAEFESGDAPRAVELAQKALELCPRSNTVGRTALNQALERFQAGAGTE